MLVNDEDKAPAFILANQGYDVWATNIRGTYHGLNNTHLDPSQPEFWHFSFQ